MTQHDADDCACGCQDAPPPVPEQAPARRRQTGLSLTLDLTTPRIRALEADLAQRTRERDEAVALLRGLEWGLKAIFDEDACAFCTRQRRDGEHEKWCKMGQAVAALNATQEANRGQ